MAMIESLASQYGRGTVITVRPYIPAASGEILRWVVLLDGSSEHDLDAKVEVDPNKPEHMVMTLVRGTETLELLRWRTDRPTPQFVDTLGGILDRPRTPHS
jgi:hypothetical protein